MHAENPGDSGIRSTVVQHVDDFRRQTGYEYRPTAAFSAPCPDSPPRTHARNRSTERMSHEPVAITSIIQHFCARFTSAFLPFRRVRRDRHRSLSNKRDSQAVTYGLYKNAASNQP